IAGVVIWFWGGEPAEGMRANIAGICFVFGFVGYLITRVRIVLHKRKSV
ncbi:MAG: zinc ribbon domain-containing protein, partial [Shewanella oncorhynchi]